MTTPPVTAYTAPRQQVLQVPCGMDWAFAVQFTDSQTGVAIDLSAPQMQVRTGPYEAATLLLTPVCTVASNIVTVQFTGASTGVVGVPRGFYDLFATRVDTGAPVKLLYGPVLFVQNVTDLT